MSDYNDAIDTFVAQELARAIASEIATAIDTGLDPRDAIGLAVCVAINAAREHGMVDFLKRLVADIDRCPVPEALRAS
jgi:hypothetical protein